MKPRATERSRWALELGVVLVLALVLLLSSDAGVDRPGQRRPVPLRAVLGPPRTVPRGLLGFNGEAVTGGRGVWSEPGFVSAVAALSPQALRVFGGAPANYWDWRAGTFVRASLLPAHIRAVRTQAHVTLSDWARIIRATHATPVFDLNLVTSDLASQLAMLRAARRLGMPVTQVELGNELYLPAYAGRFRDGAAYGRVATRWIAAIVRRFPGVKVAADAFPGGDANTSRVDARERHWNAETVRTLRGAAALSFHAYFRSGLTDGATPASVENARVLVSAPTRRWAALSRVIGRLPPGMDAWITEWNLFDPRARVHGTWAQGLAVAAFGLDLILGPRVAQADYHALVNNDRFGALARFATVNATGPPAASQFGLLAGGVAMQTLLAALAGARSSRALSFGSSPSRQIAGAALAGDLGASAVILNASGEAATVALPRALRSLPFSEHWAPPGTLITGLGSLHARTGSTAATLRLEPFSLTRVGPADDHLAGDAA